MVTKYNSTISTSKTCFSLRRKKKYFPWRFKDLWLLSCDTSESNFRDNTSGQNRQNTFGSSNESNNKALLKLSKFNCNLTAVLTSFSIFVSTIFFFLVELPRTSRTVLNISGTNGLPLSCPKLRGRSTQYFTVKYNSCGFVHTQFARNYYEGC